MFSRKYCIMVSLLFFAMVICTEAAEKKPNILFVLTDDQRWDSLGCYGNEIIKSPNLDKLASEGATLDSFYVAQPLCCPSRAVFLTGLYPHQTGILTNSPQLRFGMTTVADLFNKAGYKTGFIGKAHITSPRKWNFQTIPLYSSGSSSPHKDPKLIIQDKTEVVPGYVTQIFVDAAIRFIEANQKNRWFLWLATTAPHTPYIEDPKYTYDLSKLKPPSGYPIKNQFDARKWRGYYATITMLDEEIGRLIKKLDQLGLTNDTLVFVISDNGNMLGSHGIDGKDIWYEESIRVPAIIRWPGKIQNKIRIKSLISSVDFLPTALEAAGLSIPGGLDGVSMLPALISGKPTRTDLFSESERWSMVRKGPWKYVIESDGKKHLYQLLDDPFEARDLMKEKQEPAIVADLQKTIEVWLRRTPVLPAAKKEKSKH